MVDLSEQLNVRLTVSNIESTDPSEPFVEPQAFDHLGAQERVFIGRSPSNDITLGANAVSGKHACIIRQGTELYISDLGSRNGTFLNNAALTQNEEKPLRNGDRIKITPFEISVSFGVDALVGTTEDTAMLQARLLQDILPGLYDYEETPPKITIISGYHTMSLELVGMNTEFSIGRAPNCDMVLQDENISREHCKLRRTAKGVFVRDNNSRNGVVVNGKRLARNTEHQIADRDEVLLGTIKFRFEDPEGAQISEKVSEVVQEEPAPVRQPPSISVPKPSTPPPQHLLEQQAPAEGVPGEEVPSEGAADGGEMPPPPGEELSEVSAEGGEALAEDGTASEEVAGEEEAPPPQPQAGLTGAQKAVIGVLVVLLVLGGVLLFYLTSGG